MVVELLAALDSIRPIPTPPIAPANSPSNINVGRPSRIDLLLLGLDIVPPDESDLRAIVALSYRIPGQAQDEGADLQFLRGGVFKF